MVDHDTVIDVDRFCQDNGIDDDAARKLKECDYDMQCLVIGRGPLSDARNPSSVLLSRIRQANQGCAGLPRKPKGPPQDRGKLNQEIDAFVRENQLDERAHTCLLESEEEVCRELFGRPLKDARNPSAVVLSLIRKIKHDIDKGCFRSRDDVPRYREPLGRGVDYGKGGKGYDDKGKGKGKGDWDWYSWMPSWGGDYWDDGKGGKGGWDDGKGGKGGWDDGKGKGRPGPY